MSDVDPKNEIERIKKEYARRNREIPEDYYALYHPWNLFIQLEKIRMLGQILRREKKVPLADKRILEVGCGQGDWLNVFRMFGASDDQLYGMDLCEDKIAAAKLRLPLADLKTGDARHLPWPEKHFDIIFQSTVFTSILDNQTKRDLAQTMVRALKPQGLIIWYDFRFNNPQNPNVKGIENEEIRALFHDCAVKTCKFTLAPPISRILASWSWIAALCVQKIPFLNSHYFAMIRPQHLTGTKS